MITSARYQKVSRAYRTGVARSTRPQLPVPVALDNVAVSWYATPRATAFRPGSVVSAMSFIERLRASARAVGVLVVCLGGGLYFTRAVHRGEPVGEWMFWPIVLLWAYGALLSASCVALGARVLQQLAPPAERPPLEKLVLAFVVGLVGFVLGLYAGGFLHLYGRAFAFVLPFAMLAAGARPGFALVRALFEPSRDRPPTPRPAAHRLAAGAAVLFGVYNLILVYLEVLTPDAISFDASWVHLTIAQDYARHGRIVPFLGEYAKNITELASLVWTWGYLVPVPNDATRWMLALHLEFFVFLWTLAGLSAVAEMLVGRRVRGAWAAMFLFAAIFISTSNLNGGADHFLALFIPPLFLCALRTAEASDWHEAALAGLLAGAAVATKPQAVFFLSACALLILFGLGRSALETRRSQGRWAFRRAGGVVLAGIAGVLVVSVPHFGKAWVFYKNPFYPFGQDLFASWPTVPHAAFLLENIFKDDKVRLHGTVGENVLNALLYTVQYPFTRSYLLGPLFVLALPIVPFLRDSRRIVAAAFVGYVTLFLWAYTFRVDRNLQIFVPLLAATTCAIVVRAAELGWVARAGLLPLLALPVIAAGDAPFHDGAGRLVSAVNLLKPEGGKRGEKLRFRPAFSHIRDALPKNAVVLYHNDRPALGIDRDILSDAPGCQGLLSYEGKGGPRGLYDALRAIGVTHLLHMPAHRPAPSKEEDILFTHLQKRYAKVLLRDEGMELLSMPAVPPPPDPAHYRVLVLGLGTYADGVYALERLDTYENMPVRMRTYAKPDQRLTGGVPATLLRDVEAVLVGASGWPASELGVAAQSQFELAKAYGGKFSIYLRH